MFIENKANILYNENGKKYLKNQIPAELFCEKIVYIYEWKKGGELYEKVFDIGYRFRVHNAARRV